MNDFETHPIGTATRIAALEAENKRLLHEITELLVKIRHERQDLEARDQAKTGCLRARED